MQADLATPPAGAAVITCRVGGHEREKRQLKGVQICKIRKIAQLQQQRMQVLRCQEFEQS
jgi:hypothetical protein